MVDLDSNPTKLMDIVEIGKQLLITRGALTTFSIANDVAKYFAIIPAMFVTTYPALDRLNVMHLTSPQSAILSAVDLQRADHRGARAARAPRRALPAGRRRGSAAPQPADLRSRRDHRALHRHQADRHVPRGGAFPVIRTIVRALLATLVLAALTGLAYPLVMTGIGQVAFAHDANGSLVDVNGNRSAARSSDRPGTARSGSTGDRRRSATTRRRRRARTSGRGPSSSPTTSRRRRARSSRSSRPTHPASRRPRSPSTC